jgi:hypothetical protein
MRAALRVLTVPVVLLFAAGCSQKQAIDLHDKPGALRAGAGRALIGLPIGIPTAGYAQSPYVAFRPPSDDPGSPYASFFPATRALQTAPAAKAVVFDNGVSHVVLAKIDAVGVTDVLTERVIQLAKERIPGPNGDIQGKLILNATHTHDAGCRFSRTSVHPDLVATFEATDPLSNALAHGFDTYSQEATDGVAGAVVDAIKQATDALQPAKIGYGEEINKLAAHDRRCENDHLYGPNYTDPRVRVVRVENADTGKPIAALMNYAQHGTIYDAYSHNLSVDAPGHAEYFMEASFDEPVVAMFMQGSAGDVSPDGRGNDGSQAMQAAGYSVAQSARKAWNATTPNQSVVPLQVKERWSGIDYDTLGYKHNIYDGSKGYTDEFFSDGAVLCFQLFGSFECPPGGEHPIEDIINPNSQICLTKVMPGEGKYATRFAAARIGDMAFLAMSGEPLTKTGALLEEAVLADDPSIKHAMILGYAQDHNGYLAMDDDWLSGGYEPNITFWGWKFAGYAVQQTADVFHEMITGKALHAHKATKIPNLDSDGTPKAVPSNSDRAPAVETNVPAMVERAETIGFTFFGGDPGYGHPVVTLQYKDGDTFKDVTKPTPTCGNKTAACWTSGWIKVTNVAQFDFWTGYVASPTYKDQPGAASRSHHYEVKYEPPIDLPAGTYRFHIQGQAKQGGNAAAYDLTTGSVQVVPSTKLSVDAKVTVAGTKLSFDGTLLYPQKHPEYTSGDGSTSDRSWQVGNFRALTPRWGDGFSPAVPATSVPGGTLNVTGGGEQSVAFAYVERHVEDNVTSYKGAPETGSSLHMEATVTDASAGYTLQLPSFTDEYGNTAPAATITSP